MFTAGDIILVKEGVALGHIQELHLRAAADNLIVYIETTDTSGTKASYIVENIEIDSLNPTRPWYKFNLKEIDFTKSISESEKIIDIRDFKRK